MKNCHTPADFPIFCKTKTQCVQVYTMFRKMSSHKDLVSMYHATLSEETKSFLYQQFTSGHSDLRCLVCTIAFGMVSPQNSCMYILQCKYYSACMYKLLIGHGCQ